MPLKVGRFYNLVFLIFCGFIAAASAQTSPAQQSPTAQVQPGAQVKTQNTGEIVRDRISKAKALIAVRNYNAANFELDSIRRETADPTVQAVASVLLMNSYLEQGDYKRAAEFLNHHFDVQKTASPNVPVNYFAVAGQVVKGARTRIERYRALGLDPTGRTLPPEAVNDLERMRDTLELVVAQSKEISKNKIRSAEAMALLEEAARSRSMMARDDYDARKWQNEVADTREMLASSRSVVLSAINESPSQSLPAPTSATIADASFKQMTEPSKPAETSAKLDETQTALKSAVDVTKQEEPRPTVPAPETQPDRATTTGQSAPGSTPNSSTSMPAGSGAVISAPSASEPESVSGPLTVGSLVGYATRQTQPVYPAVARTLRTTGVVKVDVVIDENGSVADIQGATGPMMLQSAAVDAIRKWRFRPFVRDGQPVRATGYVNFSFSL